MGGPGSGALPKDPRVRKNRMQHVGPEPVDTQGEPCKWFEADPNWHQDAREWYSSLPESGQFRLYQQSDNATARMACTLYTRALERNSPGLMSVAVGMMNDLGSTMGDRRRLRIETTQTAAPAAPSEAKVAKYKNIVQLGKVV